MQTLDQPPELYLPLTNLVWIALGSSLAAALVGAGSYLFGGGGQLTRRACAMGDLPMTIEEAEARILECAVRRAAVFERLYANEINFKVSCFCGGGFDVRLGTK